MTETTLKQTPKQIRPEQFRENDLNMIADHPDTKYYDWRDDSIRIVCTSVVPNHPAYGVSFKEYITQRNQYVGDENGEKVRLSVRLPSFISHVSADFAARYRISYYRFLIMIIELGMINFQKDYCEEYTDIKNVQEYMLDNLKNENQRFFYNKAENQIMAFNISRKERQVTPTVADWLGNAIKDTAIYLNISQSDFVLLCWCIGVKKTIDRKSVV